jgi:hypothetical protein
LWVILSEIPARPTEPIIDFCQYQRIEWLGLRAKCIAHQLTGDVTGEAWHGEKGVKKKMCVHPKTHTFFSSPLNKSRSYLAVTERQ